MRRCLFRDDSELKLGFRAGGGHDNLNYCSNEGTRDDSGGDIAVHKAALTFRHAIQSLNLQSKFEATNQRTHQLLQETDNDDDDDNNTTTSSLYAGYIQTHSMMKLTNLRPVKSMNDDGRQHHEAQPYQLRQQLCTQTWPGQLSLLNERLLQPHANNNDDAANTNNTVTCLNSAETWCDHPNCNQARCGPQGCLRCYRFLPPPVQRLQQQQQQQQLRGNRIAGDLDGPGDILGAWRECTERNYDLVSFVRCGWCSVSLCNEHIDVYTTHTNDGGRRRREQEAVWFKCDECNLSSCPQCISQVFPIQPPRSCKVVTAGKRCGRQICSNCIWAVGKEGGDCVSSNIPGGKISTDDDSSQVVSIRARDDEGRRRIELLKEKEMCCSKCLRHVEFRWRELSAVLDMFDGFVP